MLFRGKDDMKTTGTIALCSTLLCTLLGGCSSQTPVSSYQKNQSLSSSEEVTLTLTGTTASFRAMDTVISSFNSLYPNCHINYEYVQDYDKSMMTRLSNNEDVDLFITNNITSDSQYLPYAMDLSKQSDALKLTDTYEGLIRNFTISGENGGLYAIPLGGEVRGIYVNTTLLDSLNLKVPSNYAELLSCCAALKAKGYIPLQGNPGNFGVMLMYPYTANLIANADDYEKVYTQINTHQAGSSALLKEPISRLYELVSNGYYDYKTVETNLNLFKDGTDTTLAMNFLNIVTTDQETKKIDDIGQVAFVPGTMSLETTLDKTKDNYHSAINYQFILSPVGDDGGYAYLSPAAGIAINKNSKNTAWALEFLNYLFSKEVNKTFASQQHIISNTTDALDVIKKSFAVDDHHISQLGQVTFDYVFYDVVKKTCTDVSKANNPKYMQADGTMYPLQYYMDAFETALVKKD